MRRMLATLAVIALANPASGAGPRATVWRGARILPLSGPEIPNGVLAAQGGRIVAVGPAA